MRFTNCVKRSGLVIAAASLFLLAACSAGPGGNGVTPFVQQASSMASLPFGKSSKDLLYVSDSGTNEVLSYAWPNPKTGGVLNGSFSEPQGECADTKGNVYITNTGDSNILEYTGTKLTNTLTDPRQYPVDCSYDTLNGNLAVSDIVSTGDGGGSVAIYKGAKGTPKIIGGGILQRVYFIAYDGSGNLFAAGETSNYGVALAELPAGSKKFKRICPNGVGGGALEFPGGLAWDGKYIVISNQDTQTVERIKGCSIVGKTVLEGSVDIVSFAIVGKYLIAPDAGAAQVEIYAYPQGGSPIQVLTGFSEPIGAAVSQNEKED
jgi:hypothetical protein